MLVAVSSLALGSVIASQGSGAAVGESAVTGSALWEGELAAVLDMAPRDTRAAAPERCLSARGAVRFYRWRFTGWRERLGVSVAWPPGRKPRSCADARYLAGLWRTRALTARRTFERLVERHVRRLDAGLAGSPMAGLGELLERHGRVGDVSPYFIVAVANKESSLGAAACSANQRNVWGLGACGRAWSPPYFASWDAAVAYFVRFVNDRWPSHSTPWSFGGYCAGCEASWASGVSAFMASRFGVESHTRYAW